MRLTDYFTAEEFGVQARPDLQPRYLWLAETLLEPIRLKFGPLRITVGFRTPEHNAAVGGVPTSWHLCAVQDQCAADCQPLGATVTLLMVFDWLRVESGLPFDTIILERGPRTDSESDDCLHVQADRLAVPRRRAYTGSTHGTGGYSSQPVVVPPGASGAV